MIHLRVRVCVCECVCVCVWGGSKRVMIGEHIYILMNNVAAASGNWGLVGFMRGLRLV